MKELEARNLNKEWSSDESGEVPAGNQRSRSPTHIQSLSPARSKKAKIMVIPDDSPFCKEILEEPIEKIKMPSCKYNGTTTPKNHLSAFESHMVLYTRTDSVWCKAFPLTL